MRLSIIIPVLNNANFTKSCLADLDNLPNDCEIIVFNNGSTDNTQDVVKKFGGVKLINSDVNLGFARACNLSYKQSIGEHVLMLNNDVRIKNNYTNWVDALIAQADDNSLVGPTGGLLDEHFNFIKETDKYYDEKYFYLSGWCLLAKKTVFNRLIIPGNDGPFEEGFCTYFEDSDLSLRAKQLGMNLKIVPVPVVHFGKATAKKLGVQNLYQSAKQKAKEKWKIT